MRNGVTQTCTHTPVHETTALITAGVATALMYDANGNLTQDERGQMLTWDHENRLSKAVTPATVTDGYLTLTAPDNAVDPALCFIDIGKRGSTATREVK